MKFEHVCVFAFFFGGVATAVCVWRFGPPGSTSRPTPSALPSASSTPEEFGVKRKNDMLGRCELAGGVPVMGYGWRVVCLKPESAAWWDDPKLPEFNPEPR